MLTHDTFLHIFQIWKIINHQSKKLTKYFFLIQFYVAQIYIKTNILYLNFAITHGFKKVLIVYEGFSNGRVSSHCSLCPTTTVLQRNSYQKQAVAG